MKVVTIDKNFIASKSLRFFLYLKCIINDNMSKFSIYFDLVLLDTVLTDFKLSGRLCLVTVS